MGNCSGHSFRIVIYALRSPLTLVSFVFVCTIKVSPNLGQGLPQLPVGPPFVPQHPRALVSTNLKRLLPSSLKPLRSCRGRAAPHYPMSHRRKPTWSRPFKI